MTNEKVEKGSAFWFVFFFTRDKMVNRETDNENNEN